MINKTTTTLLQELIDFDFAIAKTTIKKDNLNNVSARLNLKNKEKFNILDIFKLNQSLKQFIRILHFLQTTKNRLKKVGQKRPNFIIYIWCLNKYILNLIDLYVFNSELRHFVVTTDVCPVATTLEDINKRKFLFILGSPWEITPERTLHEKILYNKFYLINTLDFNAEKNEFHTYKIQNDLADYKKLILLLIIMERVISTNPLITPKTIGSRRFKLRGKKAIVIKRILKSKKKPMTKEIINEIVKSVNKWIVKSITKKITKSKGKLMTKKILKPITKDIIKPISKWIVKPITKKIVKSKKKPIAKKIVKAIIKGIVESKEIIKPIIKEIEKSKEKPMTKKIVKPIVKEVLKPFIKRIKKSIVKRILKSKEKSMTKEIIKPVVKKVEKSKEKVNKKKN